MQHLNIFVEGKPMVSLPITTPAAKEALKDFHPYLTDGGTLVVIEDKPRDTERIKK